MNSTTMTTRTIMRLTLVAVVLASRVDVASAKGMLRGSTTLIHERNLRRIDEYPTFAPTSTFSPTTTMLPTMITTEDWDDDDEINMGDADKFSGDGGDDDGGVFNLETDAPTNPQTYGYTNKNTYDNTNEDNLDQFQNDDNVPFEDDSVMDPDNNDDFNDDFMPVPGDDDGIKFDDFPVFEDDGSSMSPTWTPDIIDDQDRTNNPLTTAPPTPLDDPLANNSGDGDDRIENVDDDLPEDDFLGNNPFNSLDEEDTPTATPTGTSTTNDDNGPPDIAPPVASPVPDSVGAPDIAPPVVASPAPTSFGTPDTALPDASPTSVGAPEIAPPVAAPTGVGAPDIAPPVASPTDEPTVEPTDEPTGQPTDELEEPMFEQIIIRTPRTTYYFDNLFTNDENNNDQGVNMVGDFSSQSPPVLEPTPTQPPRPQPIETTKKNLNFVLQNIFRSGSSRFRFSSSF